MAFDPTADLKAAEDALLAVLKLYHGPCVAQASAQEENEFVTFRPWHIGSTSAILTLEPHRDGYAVVAGSDSDAMLGIGETPSEAAWRAVEALDTSVPTESVAAKSWLRPGVVFASWLWTFLSIGVS